MDEYKQNVVFIMLDKDRTPERTAVFKSIPWIQMFESTRGFLYGAIDPGQRSAIELTVVPNDPTVSSRYPDRLYWLTERVLNFVNRIRLDLDFNSPDELGLLFPKDIEFLSLLKTMPRLEDGTFYDSIIKTILFRSDGSGILYLARDTENIEVSRELCQHLIILEHIPTLGSPWSK